MEFHEVDRDDPSAKTSVYYDIESDIEISVPIQNRAKFEARNKIVYCPKESSPRVISLEFLEYAVKKGQDKAVKRVLREFTKKNREKR